MCKVRKKFVNLFNLMLLKQMNFHSNMAASETRLNARFQNAVNLSIDLHQNFVIRLSLISELLGLI